MDSTSKVQTALHHARGKIAVVRSDMQRVVLDQHTVIDLVLCAWLAREHVAIVGPQGEGKTFAAETLAQYLNGSSSYYYHLLTRFTAPDEVLGTHSIKELTQNDRLVRNTNGKAPKAKLVVIDEAFKANSAMLNSMLGMMQERVVDGTKCELETMVGISNEYPRGIASLEREGDNDSLLPLWDRFLFRYEIGRLSNESELRKLLSGSWQAKPNPSLTVTAQDADALRAEVQRVRLSIPSKVLDDVLELRAELTIRNVIISTRRWMKAMTALAANAVLNGRDSVTNDDLTVMEHVLWMVPEERAVVSEVLLSMKPAEVAMALELEAEVLANWSKTAKTGPDGHVQLNDFLIKLRSQLSELRRSRLDMEDRGEDASELRRVHQRLKKVGADAKRRMLEGLMEV